MAKILVVDDDVDLANSVADLLNMEHHTVETVYTGSEGQDRLRLYSYDAVVLDWDLPGVKGVDILKDIRNQGNMTPVLMLTGKTTILDKETGLDSGADDYLTKPFNVREFAARMRALLRRASGQTSNILKVRDIELDPITFKVKKLGVEVILVRREFALLEFFMRHPNQVFSAEALLDRVWKSESDSSPEALRTCLTRLRKKIESDADHPLIRTMHGIGYRLDS
jgi:DNA-binding response OmpR family regulator